jgi:hypothetical protein
MRIFLIYACLALLPVSADWVDVLAVSPQKTWQIQRRQTGNLSGGDPEFIDFEDLKSGRIVFSFTSTRRSTSAAWSPDGSSVFINDRIATSGDFLYIFRIVKGQIVLVRAPGDMYLTASLLEAYNQLKSTGRFMVTGRKWLNDSSLLILVSGGGYGDDLAFEAVVNVGASGQASFDKKSVKRLN